MAGAGGNVVSLAYTWLHPDEGPQDGALVLGRANDGDAVIALWADTWHQSTARLFPDAEAAAGSVPLEYEYAPSWTWQVELIVAPGSLQIVMRNSVPEGEPSVPVGAYDAMVMGIRPRLSDRSEARSTHSLGWSRAARAHRQDRATRGMSELRR